MASLCEWGGAGVLTGGKMLLRWSLLGRDILAFRRVGSRFAFPRGKSELGSFHRRIGGTSLAGLLWVGVCYLFAELVGGGQLFQSRYLGIRGWETTLARAGHRTVCPSRMMSVSGDGCWKVLCRCVGDLSVAGASWRWRGCACAVNSRRFCRLRSGYCHPSM